MTSGAWVEGFIVREPRRLTDKNCVVAVASHEYFKSGEEGAGSRKVVYYLTVYCNGRLGHNVLAFGKPGRRVLVSGRLTSRTRKIGKNTYTENAIKAERVIWLDPPKKNSKGLESFDEHLAANEYQYPDDVPF